MAGCAECGGWWAEGGPGAAVVAQDEVGGVEEAGVLADVAGGPLTTSGVGAVSHRERGPPSRYAFADEQVAGFQGLLVALGALTHIDQADTGRRRALGHAQVLDEAGRVFAEPGVVGGEPVGQHAAGADAEVRGHRHITGDAAAARANRSNGP